MRRKRYSKRPSRGKATSIASTSDAFVGDVARQQIGAPSSKTMLHESRASFLASQSSRLSCRSSVLSERPAKVPHKKAVPRADLRVGRGGRGYPFFFEIWYHFYRILRKNEKYLYSWQVGKCPGHRFLNFLDPPLCTILYGFSGTVEPRLNAVSTDWKNLFVISKISI